MIKFKKLTKIILLITAILLMSVSCDSNKHSKNYNIPLLVGQAKIFVEIADTDTKRAQGLSGREKLKNNQGMLFVFDNPPSIPPLKKGGQGGLYFWMKEMKFDLDLIWIREGKIISITAHVPHPQSITDILPSYFPPSEVDQVLEVNAGWAGKNKIKTADVIKLLN